MQDFYIMVTKILVKFNVCFRCTHVWLLGENSGLEEVVIDC